jgi:hypothetical protein
MHFVTFIVAFVFVLVAAILFGRGLVKLYSSGFMVGLWGVVIAAIIFGVFSL